jgi:hypothetical protein
LLYSLPALVSTVAAVDPTVVDSIIVGVSDQ